MFPESLRVSEVVCALSQALDLGTGSSRWHSVRTCVLGMRLAAELRLPESLQGGLYYALLLKDAGSHQNPIQQQLARDARTAQHERRGVLARLIGLSDDIVVGISGLYNRWDGLGNPEHLKGSQIPIVSRVTLIAQTLDMISVITGPDAALHLVEQEAGAWFDPRIVRAAKSLGRRGALWTHLHGSQLLRLARGLEPAAGTSAGRAILLETISHAFASVVDAKSPFTYNHSRGVAHAAVAMARKMEIPESRVTLLHHSALLHDLGKMAIPNSILQKTGTLDSEEWKEMRSHPEHTWQILNSIRGFEEIREIAASHHERLDGTGYFRGLTAKHLSVESRILAVADIFEALSANRPYRDALPFERVLNMIREASPKAFDPACLEALEQSLHPDTREAQNLYNLHRSLASPDTESATGESPQAIAVPARSSG